MTNKTNIGHGTEESKCRFIFDHIPSMTKDNQTLFVSAIQIITPEPKTTLSVHDTIFALVEECVKRVISGKTMGEILVDKDYFYGLVDSEVRNVLVKRGLGNVKFSYDDVETAEIMESFKRTKSEMDCIVAQAKKDICRANPLLMLYNRNKLFAHTYISEKDYYVQTKDGYMVCLKAVQGRSSNVSACEMDAEKKMHQCIRTAFKSFISGITREMLLRNKELARYAAYCFASIDLFRYGIRLDELTIEDILVTSA